jgi:DNA invertase Pin-like site-specific DNA recombinase
MNKARSAEHRRAWLYGRVSTRKKSQAKSPAAQLRRLAHVAGLKGWAVVGRGFDRESGAKAAELLELKRGIEAIRTARANVLMVTDLDRLGGDMRQILDTARTIDECGGHLFIESHQIDTTQGGPIGRYFFHTLAAFAELRRTLQNDKIKRGVEAARRRGRTLGRPRKHYPSAKLLARAAALRAEGESLRAIVRILKGEKFSNVPPHPTLRVWLVTREKKKATRGASAGPQ